MSALGLSIGISIFLSLIIAFAVFVSVGPLVVLLLLLFVFCSSSLVFLIVSFYVYKIRNAFKEYPFTYYNKRDFIKEIAKDYKAFKAKLKKKEEK